MESATWFQIQVETVFYFALMFLGKVWFNLFPHQHSNE